MGSECGNPSLEADKSTRNPEDRSHLASRTKNLAPHSPIGRCACALRALGPASGAGRPRCARRTRGGAQAGAGRAAPGGGGATGEPGRGLEAGLEFLARAGSARVHGPFPFAESASSRCPGAPLPDPGLPGPCEALSGLRRPGTWDRAAAPRPAQPPQVSPHPGEGSGPRRSSARRPAPRPRRAAPRDGPRPPPSVARRPSAAAPPLPVRHGPPGPRVTPGPRCRPRPAYSPRAALGDCLSLSTGSPLSITASLLPRLSGKSPFRVTAGLRNCLSIAD